MFNVKSLDLTDRAVFMTDASGFIINWSNGAKKMYGYDADEIIGKPLSALYTSQDTFRGDEPAIMLENVLLGINTQSNGKFIKKDGAVFTGAVNYASIPGDDNEPLAYTFIVSNLAADDSIFQYGYSGRTAEDEGDKLARNDLFKKLFENSHEGITLLDKGLDVIYRSSSAERINGWGNSERAARKMETFIHPDDIDILNHTLQDVLNNPGVPINCTFRSKHYNGYYIWLECVYTNFLNETEINAIVCNFKDVTEKKQADEFLERTLKELTDYKYALDESAIVAITDQKGIIQYVNDKFCQISGYSESELIGQDHRIINSSYHDNAFIRDLWKNIASGKIWRGEIKNKAKNGSFYWVDTTIVPFLNNKGKPYQYVAIRSDITERKAIEEKIIQNSGFIKTVTDNVPALIAYWTADLHCLFANKPHLEWFGKELKEMQGITKRALLGEDEFKLHENHIQRVLNGEMQSFERAFHNNKGKTIYTQTQYLPDWDGNAVKGFYSLVYDITDRKLAELKISEFNERFSIISNATNVALFSRDLDTNEIWWSESYFKLLDFDPNGSQPTREEWFSRLTPDSQQALSAILEAVQNDGLNNWELDIEHFKADGTIGTILTRGTTVRNDDQKAIRMLGSCIDITKQKEEERHKAFLTEISLVFNHKDSLSISLETGLNKLLDFGNFDMAEVWLIGTDKKKINFFAKSFRDGAMAGFYEASTLVKSFVKGEGFPGIVWKTQHWQFWQNIEENKDFLRRSAAKKAGLKTIYGIPLHSHNEIIGVLLVGFAHHEQKKNELLALFESFALKLGPEISRKQLEQELNQLFAFAPDIICTAGSDGYLKKINPAMSRLLGYSELELLGRPFIDFAFADDRAMSGLVLKGIGEGKRAVNFENRYVTRSGKIIWLAWTTTLVSEDGLIFCVAKDITEKKTLEVLHEKATTLARIGAWEIDLGNGKVSWSAIAREIHEVETDFEPDLDSALHFYRDGYSRDTINQKVKLLFETGKPYDVEVQIVTAKGNSKWIRVIGEAEFSGNKYVRLYGSFQDIDARKRAQISVAELLEEKNNILESIEDVFFAVNENWIVTYWNSAAERTMRIPKADILGKGLWDVYNASNSPETYQKYQDAMETKKVIQYERYNPKLNLWFEASIYPGDNGLTVYIKDVTARKSAEIAARAAFDERNTILESIDDAFFAIDKNWKVTYWNKMAEKLFGIPKSDVLHYSLLEQFPGMVGSYPYENYVKAIESGQTTHFEHYSEKYKAWLDVMAYPAPNGLTVYIKNVTARKAAEISAREAFDERNAILESIDDAFFAVDKNWMITYWNYQASVIVKTPSEKALQQHLWSFFNIAEDSASYVEYHRAMLTGEVRHFEDYFPPLDCWYEVSAYPSAKGLSVYFKDISERKLTEKRLKELNTSLQKQAKELSVSNAELEQFAYVASHDLQEPLRMITSFLTQLDKKYGTKIDDKGKQYIHFAVDGAKRMRQIILDLLEFSRVGNTEYRPELVDLNNLVQETKALFRKKIEETGAKIEFKDLPSLLLYKIPLRQVFQNLIGNSLKYRQPGKAPVIHITAKKHADYCQITIKDNGIGIAPEYFDKIFVIFQRLHNKDEFEGTGMGLSITKKIIENGGGKIWVESQPNKGTKFSFTIPKNTPK